MIEIEKPQIECIETPADITYGKYVVEPLERGYGTTLGNALRRIQGGCDGDRSEHQELADQAPW